MPVKRMLAFAAAASPLQLLVTVRIEGAAHEALWLLTVADSAIIAAQPASSLGAFANRESFFDAFRTPRCLSAGQRCLVLDEDPDSSRRYLDVEIQRDGPRQHIQDLADLDVRDATWASSTGSAMYLLVGCGP